MVVAVVEMVFQDEGPGGEDMQARVERLGRERPAIFKTLWREVGFCFSLLASMVMAVSAVFFGQLSIATDHCVTGILRQRFQRYSAYAGHLPRHPVSISDLAGKRLLIDDWRVPSSFWSTRRHLRWLCSLYVRPGLVLHLVLHWRL